MIECYQRYWKNCVNFQGRARRREFWYPLLCNYVIFMALMLLSALSNAPTILATLGTLYGLASLLPSLSVAIRRLHDLSKPGWWLLLGLVPLGGIVLLVFYCMDSAPGVNQYGLNPKYM